MKLIAKVPVKQTWRLASDLTGSHQCEVGVKEVYSLVVSRLPVVCKEDADLAAKTNYMPSTTETNQKRRPFPFKVKVPPFEMHACCAALFQVSPLLKISSVCKPVGIFPAKCHYNLYATKAVARFFV